MELIQAIIDFLTPTHSTGIVLYQGIAGFIIPAISLALSAASTWYGQDQAAKAEKKNDALLKERQGSIDAWYKKQSQPFLETESGKSIQSILQGQYGKVLEQNRNNSIAGGATAESDVAFKGKVLDAYNGSLLQANFGDRGRISDANNQHQIGMTDILNRQTANNSADSQNWMNLISGITSALGTVGQAYSEGAFVKDPKI